MFPGIGSQCPLSEMVRMSEDFDLEILHRDGSYLIMARAFGVLVHHKDLQAGISEALTRIREVSALYRQAKIKPGLSKEWSPQSIWGDANSPDTSGRPGQRRFDRLVEHVAPALVSAVVLSGFMLLASLPLLSAMSRLDNMLEEFTSAAGIGNFAKTAFTVVIRFGDAMDKVTPEHKQELRLAVRKIMKGLAPIIEEVGDSGEHEPPTTPPAR